MTNLDNSPFLHIALNHLAEWRDSSVDDQLTALNLLSLSSYEPHERLLYALPPDKRRNDGRIRDPYLKQYQHLDHGGWYVVGGAIVQNSDWTSHGVRGCAHEQKPKNPSRPC